MERTFLLNVVIGESTAIFELFARENQTLLIRWDPLFVLNLGLDVVNGVRWLHIEGNGLSRKGLDEDLKSLKREKGRKEETTSVDGVIRMLAAMSNQRHDCVPKHTAILQNRVPASNMNIRASTIVFAYLHDACWLS